MPPFAEQMLVSYARHFPIRKGKMRVVDALWQMAVGSRGTVREARLLYGGYTMACDLRQLLQRQFYFFGTYYQEEENLRCWLDHARQAKVIFDVGANLGIYSLAALAANAEAVVFAFEPTPGIARHLRRTAEQNGLTSRLSVHESAVAAETGEMALNFFTGERNDNEGMNFVTRSPVASKSLPVKTVTLDAICAAEGIDRIDMLKLDIQGNEGEALRGAVQLLSKNRIRCVFTELNWAPQNEGNCAATSAIRILREAGFVFAPPRKGAQPLPAGDWLRHLNDVVAIRS